MSSNVSSYFGAISYAALRVSARIIKILFAPDSVLKRPFRLVVWLERRPKTNPNHGQQMKCYMMLLIGCLLSLYFESLDVYVYSELKEKRESVMFDKRINLSSHFN